MQVAALAGTAYAGDGMSSSLHLLPAVVDGKPPALTHCIEMLEQHGMVQFADGAIPDLDFGYCLDDNARAFLSATIILSLDPKLDDARVLGEAALRFMEACERPDGRFHNLMSADGSFSDEVGSPDSLGRLIWACGIAATCATSAEWRKRAAKLLQSALRHADELHTLHPAAYAILGLAAAVKPDAAAPIPPQEGMEQAEVVSAKQELVRLSGFLTSELRANADQAWQWFEQQLTWGNARQPEALLRAGAALDDAQLRHDGMRTLEFLASITHKDDMFIPIGNQGWYERGKTRAIYDQQPIEACGMVDAWLAAARLTDPLKYESKALEAFSWFLGLNTDRLALVVPEIGGCRDGLGRGELNMNMGAESTLSYVHAHASLAAHFRTK